MGRRFKIKLPQKLDDIYHGLNNAKTPRKLVGSLAHEKIYYYLPKMH